MNRTNAIKSVNLMNRTNNIKFLTSRKTKIRNNQLILMLFFIIQGCFSLHSQPLEYDCMVVGNDYSGKYVWVPHNVYDIFVTPDGITYTNVPWDEAGGNVCEINPRGNITRKIWVGNHGGGKAVTANADYIFIAGDR